jgi:hypothetical protein
VRGRYICPADVIETNRDKTTGTIGTPSVRTEEDEKVKTSIRARVFWFVFVVFFRVFFAHSFIMTTLRSPGACQGESRI